MPSEKKITDESVDQASEAIKELGVKLGYELEQWAIMVSIVSRLVENEYGFEMHAIPTKGCGDPNCKSCGGEKNESINSNAH